MGDDVIVGLSLRGVPEEESVFSELDFDEQIEKEGDAYNEEDENAIVADDDCIEDEGEDEGSECGKRCAGCRRDAFKANCLAFSSELLTWALPERVVRGVRLLRPGMWCRECFSTWRLMLRGEINLNFLMVHLRTPEHHRQLIVWLVAFVSLRREGKTRIKKDHVLERVRSFEFFAQSIGIPMGSFVIRLFENDVEPPSTMLPSALVTTILDDKARLGYIDTSPVQLQTVPAPLVTPYMHDYILPRALPTEAMRPRWFLLRLSARCACLQGSVTF